MVEEKLSTRIKLHGWKELDKHNIGRMVERKTFHKNRLFEKLF